MLISPNYTISGTFPQRAVATTMKEENWMKFKKAEAYPNSLEQVCGLTGADCRVMRGREVLFRKSVGFRGSAAQNR